jgi:uncharacterized phage-associated protein
VIEAHPIFRQKAMSSTALNARNVADYFLANVNEDAGDNITNLKLQKLLYYAQGFHIAMHDGRPLFPESLLAWKHGPVVRSIYFVYNVYRWHAIDPPSDFDNSAYPPEIREILDAVYGTYGAFSATRLEEMTHGEPPWKKTLQARVIPRDLLRSYFSTLVNAGRENRALEGRPVWPINSFRHQRRLRISARMEAHRPRLLASASRDPRHGA